MWAPSRDTADMMSRTSIRVSDAGVRVGDIAGWPGWQAEVPMDWRAGRARRDVKGRWIIHDIPLPGSVDAVCPSADRAARRTIVGLAEAVGGHGSGDLFLDLLAASVPSPIRTRDDHQLARAFALIYQSAHDQGLDPRRALCAVYGLRVEDDVPGRRAEFPSTLDNWFSRTRDARRPDGQPYLQNYECRSAWPRRWPLRRWHPLEHRQAHPEPVPDATAQGPYAGRVLRVKAYPARPAGHDTEGVPLADVALEGEWDDGQELELEELPTVRYADLIAVHMVRLSKCLKENYPGVRVTITGAAIPH